MSPEAMARLAGYTWLGNVRELENTIERMGVMARGNILDVEEVPLPLALHAVRSAATDPGAENSTFIVSGTLEDIEKNRVLEAMEKCLWVQARACKILGITPRQLGYKLKKYKIEYRPTI
jgi:Nif-specific regulatory protein